MESSKVLPWYRHRWPWFLMAGPALAALGCIATIWLAYDHADSTIALDYYKRGLVIDQDIRRQQHAAELKLAAQVTISRAGEVSVQLQAADQKTLPQEFSLKLTHPTQSSHDRLIRLYRQGESNQYQAKALWDQPLTQASAWYLTLQTKEWRLDKTWKIDAENDAKSDRSWMVAL